MVFEKILNAFTSDGSQDEYEYEGVAAEAMEEYQVLRSEYQNDDFFQERIRRIVEEENVSVQNLEAERGGEGQELGRDVKLLGAVAEGIAIKSIVEIGISNIEEDIGSAEEKIEAQDADLFHAEDKIEELEIRVEGVLENEIEDIKSISELESSISTIASNTESVVSMLEQNSITKLNNEQMQNLGRLLKTIIGELEEIKQHDAIVSLERKVENDHISGEMFHKLSSEAVSMSENVEIMEEELTNINNAINLVSESLNLVEANSEIWIHNNDLNFLTENQQITIVNVLQHDSRLDRLSDFSSFIKEDFIRQLSRKNPGELIKGSQEFRTTKLNRFESRLQDLESEEERLKQEKEEVEHQIQSITQKASQIIEELESIAGYIEEIKGHSTTLVQSLESKISEVDDFRGNIEKYKKMRDEDEVSQIPEIENLISYNSKKGNNFDAEGVIGEFDELLRSITGDFKELISILNSVEKEVLQGEESLKSAMQQLHSLRK